jgi:hypothetical protein
LTRQIDPPSGPAKMSCHGNTPNPPANMTRQIHLPEIPPSPLKIPQAGHDLPASLPPPPRLRQRSGGRGQRADPARLCILNRYFYFPLNVYIFLQNITYTHSIQSGQNKYIMYCFRRRKSCKEGVRSWSPPGPVKGSVLHNLKYYRRPAGLPY